MYFNATHKFTKIQNIFYHPFKIKFFFPNTIHTFSKETHQISIYSFLFFVKSFEKKFFSKRLNETKTKNISSSPSSVPKKKKFNKTTAEEIHSKQSQSSAKRIEPTTAHTSYYVQSHSLRLPPF